jgi:hypothetical protein
LRGFRRRDGGHIGAGRRQIVQDNYRNLLTDWRGHDAYERVILVAKRGNG